MMKKFHAWLASNDGVTGIEYGLISAGIAMVTAVTAVTVGDELVTMFGDHLMIDIPQDGIEE
jgi:Flp pilus assembly pilin Flp